MKYLQYLFGIVYNTSMRLYRIIVDTNVWVAALISRRGNSFRLLSMIGTGRFELCVSPPLVFEYEDVLKRLLGLKIMLGEQDIDTLLDYLCGNAHHQSIYYLWRPFLVDPRDDMILEAAVSGQCHFIVTFNVGHFKGVEQFGLKVVTPEAFLATIGVLP